MRFFTAGLVVLAMSLPTAALAAGFATNPIFLSKSPVTEGDSVHIYAVVANPAASAFSGTLLFKDGSDSIGSVAISIDAGGTQTASVRWDPVAGEHTITATLTDTHDSEVGSASGQFTVAEKPQPASETLSTPAAVGSSQGIQNSIGSFSPQAEQVAQPFFTTVDSLRANASNLIETQLSTAKNKLAGTQQSGIVAGAATESPTIQNPWGTAQFIGWTFYIYLLTIVGWLVDNAGVFYPVLAVVFFFILWRIFRRIRRPA